MKLKELIKSVARDIISRKIKVSNKKDAISAKPKPNDPLKGYKIVEINFDDLNPKTEIKRYKPETPKKPSGEKVIDGGDLNRILGGFDPWEK